MWLQKNLIKNLEKTIISSLELKNDYKYICSHIKFFFAITESGFSSYRKFPWLIWPESRSRATPNFLLLKLFNWHFQVCGLSRHYSSIEQGSLRSLRKSVLVGCKLIFRDYLRIFLINFKSEFSKFNYSQTQCLL